MFLIFFFLISLYQSLGSVFSPIWIPTVYLQANTIQIFTSYTISGTTRTSTLNFISAFSGTPQVGYAIKSYKGILYIYDVGNDHLLSEYLETNLTGIATTSLTINIKVLTGTNINLLGLSYIGIDPNFPYHLNSLCNIAVN